MVAGFAAIVLPLIIETRGVSFRLTERGIERKTPWRRQVFVPWEDIRRVELDGGMPWFVLTVRTGDVVRVSQ